MSSRKKFPAVKPVARQSKNPDHEPLSDTSSDNESNGKPFSVTKAKNARINSEGLITSTKKQKTVPNVPKETDNIIVLTSSKGNNSENAKDDGLSRGTIVTPAKTQKDNISLNVSKELIVTPPASKTSDLPDDNIFTAANLSQIDQSLQEYKSQNTGNNCDGNNVVVVSYI
jgi:hypothetical protein